MRKVNEFSLPPLACTLGRDTYPEKEDVFYIHSLRDVQNHIASDDDVKNTTASSVHVSCLGYEDHLQQSISQLELVFEGLPANTC